jgi:hypothetical protein
MMFEEVIEPIGLAVSGAEMYVGDKDRSIGMWCHSIIYCDTSDRNQVL